MRIIALLAFALASFSAAAQDIPDRVGRVSYTDGQVAIYQDPDIGWEKAYVNSPLTSQNSLWTEPDARAELRVSAVAIRLDGGTQLDISRLDDDRMDAGLARGSVAVRIRHNDYGSRFVFDTPEARFTLTREGSYRIDVDTDAQQTRLAVFDGEASMETSQGVRRIPRGRMVVIADGNFSWDQAYRTDFDAWTHTRDRSWVEQRSTRYVSTFMTGYEELDPYGEWIDEPGYGALWAPTQVSADWVPYRFGHWSYVRPWGWTWIDDQPWGYAPFHYGRWVHVRDRWCWYPGRREARPAWAPALVAWVGGSNWDVSVSGGGPVMGWYPLAPTERYRPWYSANDRYVSRVNNIVINNVTINNDNRRYGGEGERRAPQEVNRALAITAVPRENLIERRPVQQSLVRVATDVARSAPVVQPQNVMPNNAEIQRMRAARARTAPPSVMAAERAAPSMQQGTPQGQPAARGNAVIGRGERGAAQPSLPLTAPQAAPGGPVAPAPHPSFARPERAPAIRGQAQPGPAPAPSMPQAVPQQQQGAPQPAPQGNPAARGRPEQVPQGNPAARGRPEQGQQERVQQQQQQEAQRQQQEAQRQQREAQQQQQQQREAQRQQQEQQRQQREAQQQQQQQREAQRQQQEAQRQQREAQQQQQQQREAQRQQQEAQRQQREAQQQQQQQREAQRQQQEAQRQQREAQQQQQQQREAQRQEAQRQQAQPPQGGNPAARGEERRRPPGDDDDKGGKRRD